MEKFFEKRFMQCLQFIFRAQFRVEDTDLNMLHGSDSPTTAEDELSKLFRVEQTVAVIKPDAIDEKGLCFHSCITRIALF